MLKQLSKSDYILGLQCPLALWFKYNRKDLKPPVTEDKQALFDTGHEVGRYAQEYFVEGVEVKAKYWEFSESVEQTQQAIRDGAEVIFEASALTPDGSYSRIDILRKHPGGDGWDLIEVKSSTQLKDYHYDDISFQYHVFHSAGYKIRDCYMMLINNEYVRDVDIDPKKLLKLHLVTEQAMKKSTQIPATSKHLIQLLKQSNPPRQDIGAHCTTPFECDYMHHCWKHVPEYSVFNLFNKNKAEELYQRYGPHIKDLPEEHWPTGVKLGDLIAFLHNEVMVNKEPLREFLKSLEYPLHFLDYETFSHAIPVLDGTSPFQQIPFQFSLHIQDHPEGELRHVKFLHLESSDPRPHFTEALVEACGTQGSILVYNQKFEAKINEELSQKYPIFSDHILKINERMVDLLMPFKSRYIYSPKQNGSASLKVTLPTFTGITYDNMEIAEGTAASRIYLGFQRGKHSKAETMKMFENLSEYCKQDTLAMVELLEVLKANTSQ